MKQIYINSLKNKLCKRSYNYINSENKLFKNTENINLKTIHSHESYNKNNLIINYIIDINYKIDTIKYNHLYIIIYTLNKSQQIEYTAIRSSKNIDNFINNIEMQYKYYK